MAGTQWFLFKYGTCATNHFESGGFVKSDPGVSHPDIELQFIPVVLREAGESEMIQHGYQVNCSLTMIQPYFNGQLYPLLSERPLTRSFARSRKKTKQKNTFFLILNFAPILCTVS